MAVTGPGEVALRPVQADHVSRASVPFTVAAGEQVPAARIEGGREFRIESDGCASPRPALACRVRVRFAPTTSGPQEAALVVGNANVHLVGAAFGVGPSLEAAPGGFAWPFRSLGSMQVPFDPVRRARIINRGDAPVTITDLTIGGRDPESFAIAEESCAGQRLAPDDECRIAIRLLSPAVEERVARLELQTDLPQEPFTVPVGTNLLRAPRPLCPCAAPRPGDSQWVLGVVGASFVRGVVTNIYTSVAARVRVTVFRGQRALRTRTRIRQLIGQQSIVVPGPLRRGSYRLRVAGSRGGKQRRIWWKLRVR